MSDDDPIGRRKNLAVQDPFQQLKEMMDQAGQMMERKMGGQTVHLDIELTTLELVEVAHLLRSMREPAGNPQTNRQDTGTRTEP